MRLIKHLKASNLLSFGPDGLDLELQDLNVLIGPNGSGKSNFLEVFEILRALPKGEEEDNNLNETISQGGGRSEWIWKGDKKSDIEFDITLYEPSSKISILKHKFYLNLGLLSNPVVQIKKEAIENIYEGKDRSGPKYYYEKIQPNKYSVWSEKSKTIENIEGNSFSLSILSQRGETINLAIIAFIGLYTRMRLYREWAVGRNTIFRTPQRADQRNDRLEADFSNLGMVLSRLRKDPVTKRALIKGLQELYEGLTDFEVVTEGSAIQVFFQEGDFSIPATRLSDGSLRYLCLLAILLDPTPPPLICIEEPELGLHPDIMPKIADLLIDASKRTQLVVTTHSDVLIDALSEQPESVLVCEKHEGQTQIKRLNKDDIAHWLKDYRLGQLWTRGEIGGTRW